jgi:glycosyltransferase involved in cell wall biosynthesis
MNELQPTLSSRCAVAIPTYNNRPTLLRLLDELQESRYPIIVVDDGSTDGTVALATQFPFVTWLRHPINRGKGAALQTAFEEAARRGFKTLITMDADGQHLAADVAPLAAASRQHPQAIIIGHRDLHAHASGDVPGSSKFGRQFSNFWVWIETGLKLPDTQSGFRAYPVELIRALRFRRSHYDFEIEAIVRAAWRGVAILSVPIQVYYPPQALRVSHFRPYLDNFRLSTLHTRLVIQGWIWRLVRLLRRQDETTQPTLSG